MSGPTDRSIDARDPLAYAPKWARDLATAERHNTGKQPSVSELADFFRRDSAEGRSADYVAATDRYPALPSLDPFGLPPPSTHRLARFSLGVAALAIAAAAIAALLLTVGKLPPWPVIAKGDDPDVASFDSRFVEQTLPPFNTNRENDPSASQVAGVKVAARSGNEDAPLSQARQRANPAAPRTLDTEEIAVLVKRGQELLATGDIAAARVSLLRAAEARDPEAALVLAATFDPIVLEKIGIYGMVAAEISSARTWYEKAKEFGSEEAPRRLRMLADREQ